MEILTIAQSDIRKGYINFERTPGVMSRVSIDGISLEKLRNLMWEDMKPHLKGIRREDIGFNCYVPVLDEEGERLWQAELKKMSDYCVNINNN